MMSIVFSFLFLALLAWGLAAALLDIKRLDDDEEDEDKKE